MATTKKDKCYQEVKKTYKIFPSARASQAIAKCRKKIGQVRKGIVGKNLKRWESEKWIDVITGKECGAGGEKEYCRPTKKVSPKTPKTTKELPKSKINAKAKEKIRVGMGKRVSKI
jgi:hypothetical protein